MSFIDPDDVAAIAVKALTEDGHAGQTDMLTSEDAYTAADLAGLLSRVVGREVKVFEGDVEALRDALIANGARGEHAPAMARYFASGAPSGHTRRVAVTEMRFGGRPGSRAPPLQD